jgi:small subunit ribosomal protein S2
MASFIFGVRNNIHIVDLAQTVPMLARALQAVSDTVANGGRVLYVGTKRQASDAIAQAAKRSAQYYVNSRWLGGMLTNWKTISKSIQRLRELDLLLAGEALGLTKKERLTLTRERDRLESALGGIKDMGGVPDLIFVIDTNKEAIAITEARRLGIPVAAVLDSNSSPDGITYPIPGNDDAGRAISLYCDLIARAAIDGIGRAQGTMGVDVGAQEEPPVEEAVATEGEAPAPAPAASETMFERPAGAPDNLRRLPGVGKVLETRLHAVGVTRFDQIAAMSSDDISRLDDALNAKGRIERDDWVGLARGLAAEGAAA